MAEGKRSTTALWESVFATDKQFVKQANNGKYNFTCIDPMYQRRVATEQWGPYGDSWGLRALQWSYVTEGDIARALVLRCEFFYPEGSFEIASDIKWTPGNDCHKKLQTDTLTKALSYLGFNGDVFMGRFDDNKYVVPATEQKFEDILAAIQSAEDVDTIDRYHEAAKRRGLNSFRSGQINDAVKQRKDELSHF